MVSRLRSVLEDFHFSARALRKRPGFALLAILTVGLGLGVNTAMFAIVHSVLWKPLDYVDPDRLVTLNESSASGVLNCSYQNAEDWRAHSSSFDEIALFRGFPSVTLRLDSSTETVNTGFAHADLFSVFQIKPALGRIFNAAEDSPGGEVSGVITQRAWERYFGKDPSVVGRRVRAHISFANKTAESIVITGVLPPGFRFSNIDLWIPLNRFWGPIDSERGNHWFLGIGRLKSGVTTARARTELDAISRDLEAQYPGTNKQVRAVLTPLIEIFVGRVRTPLLLLMGSVGFVLLIACGNVAHLLLTRTLGRDREIAVRLALGAGRGRLVQLLLTEGFLIVAAGGVLAAFFSNWAVAGAVALEPGILPRSQGIAFSGASWIFGAAIAVFTFLALGFIPAWQASRATALQGLRTARGGTDRRRQRLGWVMIGAEVAMAAVLLAGAGLMIQTLRNLSRISLGYQPEQVVSAPLTIPGFKYKNDAQLTAVAQQIQTDLHSLPGFVSAAFASPFNVGGNGMLPPMTVPGRTNPSTPPMIPATTVSREFFDTLRIPILAGRTFSEPFPGIVEVIVNEEFAKRYFPGENPLGKQLSTGGRRTIVGVVGNTKIQGTLAVTQPEIYWAGDGSWSNPTLLVRATGSTAALIRERLKQVEPEIRIGALQLLTGAEDSRTSIQRFTRTLLLLFAAIAVILASLGIYGVASYSVLQRTREIGIRMALGATRENVAWLILGQTFLATITGAIVGAAGGSALARYLGNLLYGVSSQGSGIFAAVLGLIILVAMIASAVPVFRASRIDPAVCLRQE
jgi:putative ABC transport system permease protein